MRSLRVGLLGVILVSVLVPRAIAAAAHRVAVVEANTSKVPRGEVAALRADVEDVVRSLGAESCPLSRPKPDGRRLQSARVYDRHPPRAPAPLTCCAWNGCSRKARSPCSYRCGTPAPARRSARTARAATSAPCPTCTGPARPRRCALLAGIRGRGSRPRPAACPAPAGARPPTAATSPGSDCADCSPCTSQLGWYAPRPGGRHRSRGAGCGCGSVRWISLASERPAELRSRRNDHLHPTPTTGGAGAGFLAGGIGAAIAGGILFYSFTW